MAQCSVTFVRHGNAVPLSAGGSDHERPLSERGRQQARERGGKIGDPSFDLVLLSPTRRTKETALYLRERENHVPRTELTLTELFTPKSEDGEVLDDMFARLKYAPLDVYRQEPPAKVGCLRRFGDTAWSAILKKIEETGATSVLVVGHAVLLPQIGWTACDENSDPDLLSSLLSLNMPECGAFRLELESSRVVGGRILD